MSSKTILFFDGGCPICHSFVLYIKSQAQPGQSIFFAPLQGQTASQNLSLDEISKDVLYLVHAGQKFSAAHAVFKTLSLTGGWRVIFNLGFLVPALLADPIYRVIAKNRFKIFKNTASWPELKPEDPLFLP